MKIIENNVNLPGITRVINSIQVAQQRYVLRYTIVTHQVSILIFIRIMSKLIHQI